MSINRSTEILSGFLMLGCLCCALLLSNTSDLYQLLVHQPWNLEGKLFNIAFHYKLSLQSGINHFLMIFFFLDIGMELKAASQETGARRSRSHLSLPAVAALGGMLLPALIYWSINSQYPGYYVGCAIPCATDIALALCLFNLLGRYLPPSMRIFLLSIAIFDDLGAMLLIAIFYTKGFHVLCFLSSILPLILLWFLNRQRITALWIYAVLGLILCSIFQKSGIHPTLGGFLVGLSIPTHHQSGKPCIEPLQRKLHPIVQWIILPLFAFSNGGIVLQQLNVQDYCHPIVWGISLGLFIGKPLGITGFSYGLIRFKGATLPKNSRMKDLAITSIFGGIGFSMSLFMGLLAFEQVAEQSLVKIGILLGSLACIVVVTLAVLLQSRHQKRTDHP